MAREMSNAAAERAAAKKALANGDLKDRETYTAKQVATRLGTDAKTMRKFFRSNHSTVEPVGQGGRYEFAATDFPQIKREFEAWRSKASSRSPIKTPAKQALQEQIRKTIKPEPNDSDTLKVSIAAANATGDEPPTPETMHDFVEDEFLASIDLPEDPSDDELEELEDMDLDLDDLDETE